MIFSLFAFPLSFFPIFPGGLLPAEQLDPDAVTPGPMGFLFTMLLVLAVLVIGIDMTRRIRRARYREQLRIAEQLEKSLAESLPPSLNVDPPSSPDAPERSGKS